MTLRKWYSHVVILVSQAWSRAIGGIVLMRGEIAVGLLGKERCSVYHLPRTSYCCCSQNLIPNSIIFLKPFVHLVAFLYIL